MALNEQHLPPAQVLTHEVCSAHGWHHQAASHLTGDTTEQVLPADATLKKACVHATYSKKPVLFTDRNVCK